MNFPLEKVCPINSKLDRETQKTYLIFSLPFILQCSLCRLHSVGMHGGRIEQNVEKESSGDAGLLAPYRKKGKVVLNKFIFLD